MTPRSGNKRNYQRELDEVLKELEKSGERKTLLLHSCCAPCSSYCLKYLAEYFDITDLYYNPNITDREEYDKRKAELGRLIEIYNEEGILSEEGMAADGTGHRDIAVHGNGNRRGRIRFIEGRYEPELFFKMADPLKDIPEGGRRCYLCYELRLREAARCARDGGFDFFTTTLSISPHKNADWINEIGERLSEEYKVKHLPSDFKKRDGYKTSIELSAKYGLYRQDYCGCVYSRRDGNNEDNT